MKVIFDNQCYVVQAEKKCVHVRKYSFQKGHKKMGVLMAYLTEWAPESGYGVNPSSAPL